MEDETTTSTTTVAVTPPMNPGEEGNTTTTSTTTEDQSQETTTSTTTEVQPEETSTTTSTTTETSEQEDLQEAEKDLAAADSHLADAALDKAVDEPANSPVLGDDGQTAEERFAEARSTALRNHSREHAPEAGSASENSQEEQVS